MFWNDNTKKPVKLFFHSLFCNSWRSAKSNTVTKLKEKKNTVSEIKCWCKNKCEHSSIWPLDHYEKKIWEKDIYSINIQFEEIRVTHEESRRKHTLNKNHFICDILFKCMSSNYSYKKVTYKVLTLRRKNVAPNKSDCF